VPALFAAITNGTTAALSSVPGINSNILATMSNAIMDANSSSFKIVYLSTLGFGGVSIIAACFATDVTEYMTNFVNKTIHSNPKHDHVEKLELENV
jgi:uncharacterized membrane protein